MGLSVQCAEKMLGRQCCVLLISFVCAARGYFTLPGRCPENVKLQEEFRLANFYKTWHQVYHYSSDGRQVNNCSSVQLVSGADGVHVNMSRVDRGLFGRYSVGDVNIPTDPEDSARLSITFTDEKAPRRLSKRTYPFWVLATTDHFAAVYTCQYSPLIDKHYIYAWVLSRTKVLNPVSLQLASDALQRAGVAASALRRDDLVGACALKYFEETPVAPTAFRYPVPV